MNYNDLIKHKSHKISVQETEGSFMAQIYCYDCEEVLTERINDKYCEDISKKHF
jgi:hypothetical protein